ncbi:MgtC/SapB family protein [Coprobacter sp.]
MFWEFVLRLFVAGLLGAIIGLEREYRAKEAGFRTHFLVSLGSALIMIVSQHGFQDVIGGTSVGFDPSRVAAQVVTGIGFIGAGTIIIQRQFVRGLTTAAGIWVASGIGLAIGGGMYGVGVAATFFTLLGLELLTVLFKRIGLHSSYLQFSTGQKENLQKITDMVAHAEGRITNYSARKEFQGDRAVYYVSMVIKTRDNDKEGDIFTFIQNLPDLMIEKIE